MKKCRKIERDNTKEQKEKRERETERQRDRETEKEQELLDDGSFPEILSSSYKEESPTAPFEQSFRPLTTEKMPFFSFLVLLLSGEKEVTFWAAAAAAVAAAAAAAVTLAAAAPEACMVREKKKRERENESTHTRSRCKPFARNERGGKSGFFLSANH